MGRSSNCKSDAVISELRIVLRIAGLTSISINYFDSEYKSVFQHKSQKSCNNISPLLHLLAYNGKHSCVSKVKLKGNIVFYFRIFILCNTDLCSYIVRQSQATQVIDH